ncbi:hypothetical protein K440DRAFT_637384 [Wilcoxina mikolae CBS 423.85]|nr:hypothetical protein K440DRAFT_637384 [Wilcoxina mikolae CBS 423.85]
MGCVVEVLDGFSSAFLQLYLGFPRPPSQKAVRTSSYYHPNLDCIVDVRFTSILKSINLGQNQVSSCASVCTVLSGFSLGSLPKKLFGLLAIITSILDCVVDAGYESIPESISLRQNLVTKYKTSLILKGDIPSPLDRLVQLQQETATAVEQRAKITK